MRYIIIFWASFYMDLILWLIQNKRWYLSVMVKKPNNDSGQLSCPERIKSCVSVT